jgi:NTP pyrophosphatase (non-canonical NTP hydrolase)
MEPTIASLTQEMRANSERWFPQIHDGSLDLMQFYTLGLIGETGEVANVIKKMIRQAGEGDVALYAGLATELADVFTYLLLLAQECGVDLVQEYRLKAAVNEERWG